MKTIDVNSMNKKIITTIDFYDEMSKYRDDLNKNSNVTSINSLFYENHYQTFFNMIKENERLLKCYQFTQFQKIAGRIDIYVTDITDYLLSQPHIDLNAIDYQRPVTLYKSYSTKQELIKSFIYEDFKIDPLLELLDRCHIELSDLFRGLDFAIKKMQERKEKVKSM